ncbi:alpha/beta hydrolase [Sphingomonas sp. PL-96]|uniref:alpha/beta hydrolase n=1 Tax=Sphingomonas sp. PL-96 TaxID=2887201 RepID=UPI001E5D93BC|nr:alpha/beta hydrolase [Sphingomonas sp. PL-96]MCC2978244.1 alpha/beta hydrolase [Sphingomonas sp. PL-96]
MNILGRLAAVTALSITATSATAQTTAAVSATEVPNTVSPETAAQLKFVYGFMAKKPGPRPTSPAEWDRQAKQNEAAILPLVDGVVKPLNISYKTETIGRVPVLRIRPTNYRPGQVLIYVHGGGYVSFSARSSLVQAALIANATGDEVISIDYTLAPHGKFQIVTDQVLSVWRELLANGVTPSNTGMFGDSAGGGLAAGSVLKMRDKGLPLPGALWLLSPWSDITQTGDTYTTLAAADPTLDAESLSWAADAYAAPEDQKNPYASPVYGDYSKAFPPTLIQVGLREIFLSTAVRHYQAIRSGGHEAVLDAYEGMPHVFQAIVSNTVESKTAVARAAAFFREHLKP